ncbi:hypothetical protein J6590_021355 [Homalodisca vitripennis]|nr:hypothetical protein J6590_021355 [Homalodisca vitripennis]
MLDLASVYRLVNDSPPVACHCLRLSSLARFRVELSLVLFLSTYKDSTMGNRPKKVAKELNVGVSTIKTWRESREGIEPYAITIDGENSLKNLKTLKNLGLNCLIRHCTRVTRIVGECAGHSDAIGLARGCSEHHPVPVHIVTQGAISTAQHAKLNVNGQMEPFLSQFIISSSLARANSAQFGLERRIWSVCCIILGFFLGSYLGGLVPYRYHGHGPALL